MSSKKTSSSKSSASKNAPEGRRTGDGVPQHAGPAPDACQAGDARYDRQAPSKSTFPARAAISSVTGCGQNANSEACSSTPAVKTAVPAHFASIDFSIVLMVMVPRPVRYNQGSMEPPSDSAEGLETAIPLFPLPNVILFPGAVLPLHIFEERYKTMTADALAGDRLIAMALLRPGWEKDYYGKPAIEPVVCVGRIARWERLEDGRYNFLLHGQTRARILGEKDSWPYRLARVAALREDCVPEDELADQRRRLTEMFRSEPLASLPLTAQLQKSSPVRCPPASWPI